MKLPKSPSRGRRLLAKFLLIAFGFFLGAVIAEVALRVIGYSFPEFYQPDQSRGYALRPGIEGWYRKEGEAFVRINSAGLRDREHAEVKPPDVIRIAVIGDSYPEAFQVPIEDAFWMVMEKKLSACDLFKEKRVELINFGVSGYGTAQELITLREQVWKYSPDIVLLTITTNNDITDNSRALKKTDKIPYFAYREGKLALDNSFQNLSSFRFQHSSISAFGRWLRDHSRLLQAIGQGHRALRIKWAELRSKPAAVPDQKAVAEKSDVVSRSEELGTDNVVYVETEDPVWKEAWAVTEGLIGMMHDEVKSHGARFLVVTLSNGPQVYPDVNVRTAFMRRFAVQDIFYPDHRIEAFCNREGIAVVVLAPQLQSYADQNRAFLHGFNQNLGLGHWNSTGHRVAGELLSERLCTGEVLK